MQHLKLYIKSTSVNIIHKVNFDRLKEKTTGDLLPHVSINFILLQNDRYWVIEKGQRFVSWSSGCWEAQD